MSLMQAQDYVIDMAQNEINVQLDHGYMTYRGVFLTVSLLSTITCCLYALTCVNVYWFLIQAFSAENAFAKQRHADSVCTAG